MANNQAPDGWAAPTEKMKDDARTAALAALRNGGEHPVADRLASYYRWEGNYAGASFVELAPVSTTDITAADLHAATLLSIEIGPRTTRRLLDEGGFRTDVLDCLSKIEPTYELSGAGADLFSVMANFYQAVKRACADPHAAASNRWATASKLCARKRPGLFPVRDNNVCKLLGLIGTGKPVGNFEIDWLVFRHLLEDHEIIAAIDTVQSEVKNRGAEYRVDQHRLRVLDAALWTYTVW